MHRALGLLLLAAEGALAQSWEPSDWDANVSAYGGTVETDPDLAGCPCNATAETKCDTIINPTTEQTGTSELEVTYDTNQPTLKFAYLTDQDGTIISYNANGWDTGSTNKVTFDWDSSKQPTGIVPHLVYETTCEDVVPRTSSWNDTDSGAPRHLVTKSIITSTWRAKLARWTQEYDVGNTASDIASPPYPPPSPPSLPPSPQLPKDSSPVSPPPSPVSTPLPEGTPTLTVANDITLDADWFNNGGTAKAEFPDTSDAGANALWLTNQDGTILNYQEKEGGVGERFVARPFPRGTVKLHACRLFKTKKLCATASVVDKYIAEIGGTQSTDGLQETPAGGVGAYTATNTDFTDVFTGHFDPGPLPKLGSNPKPGRTSIGPKNINCTQYVIYANKLDDNSNSLLAFAFDKPIHFAATAETKYNVTLTCDGTTRTTGTMDISVFSGPQSYSTGGGPMAPEVGSPRCLADDHADHDHAEGAEEEEGHPSDNTTWFEHEGRDCMCDKGTLLCKRADSGSPFSMNEGETVGLVIAVSAIVFICIGAIFFFGFSFLLKRKQNDKGVVLQSDGDRL